jgi:branched-chain amino acid aminotransferase
MENIDWNNLGFGYLKTEFNVRCNYKNGAWGDLEVSDSEYFPMHIAATAIHYGQESFEGLKAFRGKDGKVRIFRMDENARRMQDSSAGTLMAQLPLEKFMEAVVKGGETE